MTKKCDVKFAKKYKGPSTFVQHYIQKYVYKTLTALSFYLLG